MTKESLPRVTIVVPAYQAEATIRETLRSLSHQTYSNLEIIVVDDGSLDTTVEVVQKTAIEQNMQICLLRQNNSGQSAALNRGWHQASGRYLGYLGADDVLYPTALAKLVDFLETHSELIGAYPDYDLIDAHSRIIRRVRAPEYNARELVEDFVCQPGPGAIFRREAFELTGGWDRSLRQIPDFDFWLRVSRYGKLARVPKTMAGFRVHEHSQTFAAPPIANCEEPPLVMAAFLACDGNKWNSRRAMAWSNVISARLHLRGGRAGAAFTHLARALRSDAAIAMQLRFWRLLGSGFFGQLHYRLRANTRHL